MKARNRKNVSRSHARERDTAAWSNLVPSAELQRELKREALLRAAIAAFNNKGFHQTSLDEIALRLGVTKPALYHYFPNKNAILAACFDRAMKLADESLARGRQEGRNGREKVVLMFRYYLAAMTAEMGGSLLLTEEHALEPEDRAVQVAQRDKLERKLRALVREGIRDGSIVKCDPKLTVLVMLGAVNWVPKWFSHDGPWTSEDTAFALTEMLDRMLSSAPGRALTEDVAALTRRRRPNGSAERTRSERARVATA